MNEKCIDEKMSRLIHAYEFDLLDEENREKFEKHLLSCDFCLKEVTNHEALTETIHESQEILNELDPDGVINKKTVIESSHNISLTRYLRVAAVILLIAIPALSYYLFWDKNKRPTEIIQLFPDRSESNMITVSDNSTLEFHFVFEESHPENSYTISITDGNGEVVYYDENFSLFDAYDVGRLSLPSDSLAQGRYILRVIDHTNDSLINSREYRFNIYYK